MCSNFANLISLQSFPATANTNNFVPLDSVDTKDWTVSGNTLTCNNSGIWNIVSQYQIVGINDISSGANGTLEGWFNINNFDIPDSAAIGYVSKAGGSVVLTIGYAHKFNKGDVLRFGVRSDSIDGNLNIGCKAVATKSGVRAPSFICTLTKVKGCP